MVGKCSRLPSFYWDFVKRKSYSTSSGNFDVVTNWWFTLIFAVTSQPSETELVEVLVACHMKSLKTPALLKLLDPSFELRPALAHRQTRIVSHRRRSVVHPHFRHAFQAVIHGVITSTEVHTVVHGKKHISWWPPNLCANTDWRVLSLSRTFSRPEPDTEVYRCCEHLPASYAGHVPGFTFHSTGRTSGLATWGVKQYMNNCMTNDV